MGVSGERGVRWRQWRTRDTAVVEESSARTEEVVRLKRESAAREQKGTRANALSSSRRSTGLICGRLTQRGGTRLAIARRRPVRLATENGDDEASSERVEMVKGGGEKQVAGCGARRG